MAAKKPRTTPSHPKTSKWYAPLAEDRVRKPITITMDDKVREQLAKRAAKDGEAMSVHVEKALLAYWRAR